MRSLASWRYRDYLVAAVVEAFAAAVAHLSLLGLLRRVTAQRWHPVDTGRYDA